MVPATVFAGAPTRVLTLAGCDGSHDALTGGSDGSLKGGDGRSQGGQSDAGGNDVDGCRGHHDEEQGRCGSYHRWAREMQPGRIWAEADSCWVELLYWRRSGSGCRARVELGRSSFGPCCWARARAGGEI
jgi:hypothetical protein